MDEQPPFAIYTDFYGKRLPVRVLNEVPWGPREGFRIRIIPLHFAGERQYHLRPRFVKPWSLSERMTLDQVRAELERKP